MPETPSATEKINQSPRSFLRLAVASGIGLFSFSIIAGSRGRFETLLDEFELPWPTITTLALNIVLPVALIALVITTITIELVVKGPATKNTWNAVAIGLALACLATYIIGVSLPLMQLIHDLS